MIRFNIFIYKSNSVSTRKCVVPPVPSQRSYIVEFHAVTMSNLFQLYSPIGYVERNKAWGKLSQPIIQKYT